MYGVPPRGHLQGQTRDNSNTVFFHTKKEHIDMCSFIISVVYICRIISCLKGVTLFYHIPPTYGMYISLVIRQSALIQEQLLRMMIDMLLAKFRVKAAAVVHIVIFWFPFQNS